MLKSIISVNVHVCMPVFVFMLKKQGVKKNIDYH